MKTSYTFYALDNLRYSLMLIGLISAIFMIFSGIWGKVIPLIFTKEHIEYSTSTNIIYLVISLLALSVLALIIERIAYLYAEEKWTICFDDEEIEIGSNRRPKKIFLISQLIKVTCQKCKYLWGKSIRIRIQLEKRILPQYTIGTSKGLFSSTFRKKNLQHFNQFFDSFHEQILQSQFKQVTSKLVTIPLTFVRKDSVQKIFIL